MSSISNKRLKLSAPPPPLPNELLLSDVLTRLPVEPLLRFGCVSKLCRTTIADPKFVSSHFLQSKANPHHKGHHTAGPFNLGFFFFSNYPMESPWSDSPLVLEDFGQRVELPMRICEVLVNYPEGTTVLNELIQNANDAGATKVCLCLDRRVHGVESLWSDKLAQWQGPWLLAYNTAEFTEEDFVSISRIGVVRS